MTHTQAYTLGTDPAFIGRISIALMRHAGTIVMENPATPEHEIRRAIAQRAMLENDTLSRQFARMCAAIPEMPQTPTDAHIDEAVRMAFSYYQRSQA